MCPLMSCIYIYIEMCPVICARIVFCITFGLGVTSPVRKPLTSLLNQNYAKHDGCAYRRAYLNRGQFRCKQKAYDKTFVDTTTWYIHRMPYHESHNFLFVWVFSYLPTQMNVFYMFVPNRYTLYKNIKWKMWKSEEFWDGASHLCA